MPKKKEPKRAPRLGASYRAGATAIVVLSPVTDEVINSVQSRNFSTLATNLKSRVTVATGANLLITAADAALDSKLGHSAALSRGSLTAWGAEAVRLGAAISAGAPVIGGVRTASPRDLNAGFAQATTGFDAKNGTWSPMAPSFMAYQGFKRGGQILRRLSGKSFGRRVLGPVKKGLKAMGVTL